MTRSEGESSCGCITSIWKSFVAFLKWIFCCTKAEKALPPEVPSTPESTGPTAEEIDARAEEKARSEVDKEIRAMSLDEGLAALVQEDGKEGVSYREHLLYLGIFYEMRELEGEARKEFLGKLFAHVKGSGFLSRVLIRALTDVKPTDSDSFLSTGDEPVDLDAVQRTIIDDPESQESTNFYDMFASAAFQSISERLRAVRTEDDEWGVMRLAQTLSEQGIYELALKVNNGKLVLEDVPQYLRQFVELAQSFMNLPPTENKAVRAELIKKLEIAKKDVEIFELASPKERRQIKEAMTYLAGFYQEGSIIFRID